MTRFSLALLYTFFFLLSFVAGEVAWRIVFAAVSAASYAAFVTGDPKK